MASCIIIIILLLACFMALRSMRKGRSGCHGGCANCHHSCGDSLYEAYQTGARQEEHAQEKR